MASLLLWIILKLIFFLVIILYGFEEIGIKNLDYVEYLWFIILSFSYKIKKIEKLKYSKENYNKNIFYANL